MNLSFKKMAVPAASAIVGGLVVLAALKMNPALLLKLDAKAHKAQKTDAIFKDILKDQKGIQKNFDDLFDEDSFEQEGPFKYMKEMREQMKRRMGGIAGDSKSRSSPFDAWFSDKFDGGSAFDISIREDDGFVYYDIKVDDLNSASINTKVENGYVTITGTVEKKNEENKYDEEDKLSSQYIYKSTFNRTFPLPENVNADKMQMTPDKNKIVLKFPKVNA